MLNKQLSVREAAELLGVSVSHLNKKRVYGGGPAYRKLDARVVYDPADLAAYLDARRVTSTSQCVGAA